MRSLSVNLGSFVMASIVVLALSLVLLQIGAFGEDPGGDIVLHPTTTPAVLDATRTPAPATE
jgi:hypothetical protein